MALFANRFRAWLSSHPYFYAKKDISASGRRYLFLLQNHLKGKFIFLGEQAVKATRMHEENPFAVGKGLLF